VKQIEKEQALYAVNHGDFGDDIIRSAERVAVILTQSWCPQWHAMQRFIMDLPETEIYVLEYDRTDYFDLFRTFKEQVLGNDQIPYIRYYHRGILVAQSNAVHQELFRQNLEKEKC
jgi:hypothetical protein